MPEAEVRVDDLTGVLHTWLGCEVEDLEFDLPSGKVATDLFIMEDEAVFRASEEFGEGFTPYADSPDKHREYLESEDVAETDGVVEYVLEHGSIELPRVIYFEQRVEFSDPVTATDPDTIAERLEEELNGIDSIDRDIEVTAPDSL
jgi:hypothetical protein